jgi:MYXO-CTERM domain-containing protein
MNLTRIGALALTLSAGLAAADTILDTGEPQGGFLGYYGFDLSPDQSVAIAFTPDQDYRLDSVGLWMMSNDFDAAGRAFTVSVRTDANGGMTVPGTEVIEGWNMTTSAQGWSPVLDSVNSALNPILEAGTTYWIVAESDEPAFFNPVWVASSQTEPVWHSIRNSLNPNGEWISGYGQGVPGLVITGTVVPAPGAAALLGLGAVAALRRRR